MAKRIVVTGASGFIGQGLVARLRADGHDVVPLVRAPSPRVPDAQIVPDLVDSPLDPAILADADLLVNLAGSLYASGPQVPQEATVNARLAQSVAEAARAAGVPAVVQMSSIAASLAERGDPSTRPYGIEKAQADAVFRQRLMPEQTLIVLRPVAIYGQGMTGSFNTLVGLVRRGLPLPFGAARTPRPYLALPSLLDAMSCLCAAAPDQMRALSATPLELHDGHLVSTADLVEMIASELGKPARLVPVPKAILSGPARLAGKSDLISGIFDGVPCTISPEWESVLGWHPPRVLPETLDFLRT